MILRFCVIIVVAAGCSVDTSRFSGVARPSGLTYATNPATYFQNQRIANNLPTLAYGAADKYTVNPPLPPGLALDGITGAISGTPAVLVTNATYTVTATNSAGSFSVALALAVVEAAPTLTYASSDFVFVTGEPSRSGAPLAQGGVITACAATALPSGFLLNPLTCEVTGVSQVTLPETSYALALTYSGGQASSSVTFEVRSPLQFVSPTMTLPAVSTAQQTLVAQGGQSPYQFVLSTGSGSVNGAVYTAGTQSGTDVVEVIDAAGRTATATITLMETLFDGQVLALAASGNSVVVGGTFSRTGFSAAPNVLALQTNGAPDYGVDLQTGFDGPVSAFVDDGNYVFVGGGFHNYRGQAAWALVRIDKRNGVRDPNFDVGLGLGGSIQSLATPGAVSCLGLSGTNLIVGGAFATYDGAPASQLIALDHVTGQLTAAASTLDSTMPVKRCVADDNNVVAAFDDGGGFAAIFHLDPGSLIASAGFPIITTSDASSLAMTADTIFVGLQAQFGAASVAAFGMDSGAPITFPDASATELFVDSNRASAMLLSGTTLYVGVASGTSSLVAVDVSTGMPTSDSINQSTTLAATSQISALALSADGLYVGGIFAASEGGQTTQNLIRVDPHSGAADALFAVSPGFGDNDSVNAILPSGGQVFVGGTLQAYQGQAMPHLALLDMSISPPALYRLSNAALGNVMAVAIDASNLVYYVSSADKILHRMKLDGTQDTAFVSPLANTATTLTVAGSTIIVGENVIGTGAPIEAFNLSGGSKIAAASSVTASYPVASLVGYDGFAKVYVGLNDEYFATFATSNYAVQTPILGFYDSATAAYPAGVRAFAPLSLGLAFGGSFGAYKNGPNAAVPTGRLVVVDTSFDPLCPGESIISDGQVNALWVVPDGEVLADDLFVGGSFTSSLMHLPSSIGETCGAAPLTPERYQLTGTVNTLTQTVGLLFVGGSLSAYNGERVSSLIALDPVSGSRQHF